VALAVWIKKMLGTVIIVTKVSHKIFPYKFFQFGLDGDDRLAGVDYR